MSLVRRVLLLLAAIWLVNEQALYICSLLFLKRSLLKYPDGADW